MWVDLFLINFLFPFRFLNVFSFFFSLFSFFFFFLAEIIYISLSKCILPNCVS